MTRSPQLRRLHFLNALFAPLTGRDLYLAQQIDDAIASTLTPASDREPGDPEFVNAAARLFTQLCAEQPQHGFYHWDAGAAESGDTPLFARAGVMQGLRRLACYPEATLLITNLESAHRPAHKRWTARRRQAYQDNLTFIRELAAARSRPGVPMNVVFI